jgi:hypothetical protein
MGTTSAENVGLMPTQEKVLVPPPPLPPVVVGLDLLHAANVKMIDEIQTMIASELFIKMDLHSAYITIVFFH